MRSPRPTPGWSALLLVGIACQPPLIVDDDDGTYLSTASTDDGNPPASTTTSSDPMTSDSSDPSVADDTSTGRPPSPEDCDPFAQDCPPGHKCTFYVDEQLGGYAGVRCVEVVDDPQAPLEPCSVPTWPPDGNDDCDATSYCYGVRPETMQGMCAAFCIGGFDDLHCADPCQYCRVTGDADLPCLPTCDPLIISCPEGQGCYPIEGVFVCTPVDGGVALGEPCEFLNACEPGLACLAATEVPTCPAGAAGCCSPICDPGAAFDPCPKILPGTVCTPYYTPGERPLPGCGFDPPGSCRAP